MNTFKLNFNEIKKLIDADKTLIVKEIDEGLIIKRSEGSKVDIQEIILILRQFGVKDSSFEVTEEGTLVESSVYNAQKLKMIIAPFYKLGELEVISNWKLLLKGIFIVEEELKAVPGAIHESGSADELGVVPNKPIESNDGFVTIEDVAKIIDENFTEIEIKIIDDKTIEISPVSDELVEYLATNEAFDELDITIENEKIIIVL